MNKMTDVLLIGSSSVFGSVLLIIFRSLCCVGFIFLLVLFVFAMCLVFPMLPASLKCPFSIASSVFPTPAYYLIPEHQRSQS